MTTIRGKRAYPVLCGRCKRVWLSRKVEMKGTSALCERCR